MHEKERHRIIVSAVTEKPVVTVTELVELTDSSEATIRREALKNNLDPAWVAAEIRAESIFYPRARSSANAMGLMQVLPGTGAGSLVGAIVGTGGPAATPGVLDTLTGGQATALLLGYLILAPVVAVWLVTRRDIA